MNTPNPGSDEAKNQGCLCATLDNNHGKWPIDGTDRNWEDGGAFWITDGCKLHSPEEENNV